MKTIFTHCSRALVLLFFAFICQSAQAQTVSPRTGNEPVQQFVSFEQFNNLPAEIQTIVKNNPALYRVGKPIQEVEAMEFQALPAEKQKYMLEHPEQYRIIKKPEAPAPSAVVKPAPKQ